MLGELLILLLAVLLLGGLGLVALLYLAPGSFYLLLTRAMCRRAALVRHEVTLAGGLRFVFLDGGKGEPLLLLHGFGASKETFLAIAPYLTRHFRLIIPDIIGFGESARLTEGDYSPGSQVDRLYELLQELGISAPVHVGGNSMGGMLALVCGARHPAATASLWLLDPAAVFTGPLTEVMRIAVHEQRNPFDLRTVDDLLELLNKAFVKPPWMPRPILAWQLREFIANREVQNRVFVDTMKTDVTPGIRGMTIPTLIVWGDHDEFVHPAGAEVLHELLPNSQVIIMRDIGHIPQMEAPRRTAADFVGFHASLTADRP
jgi:pimeloyl-ACP methyl ester carboxylesterase